MIEAHMDGNTEVRPDSRTDHLDCSTLIRLSAPARPRCARELGRSGTGTAIGTAAAANRKPPRSSWNRETDGRGSDAGAVRMGGLSP